MAGLGTDWEDQQVGILADQWEVIGPGVKRFRLPGNEPVRRIITGRRNGRVGALYSWKNGGHVAHESSGEERLARVLEVHPSVTAYFGQPETILFECKGAKAPIRYTPDFLVLFGRAELRVEYKRLIDIRPPKPRPGDERAHYRFIKAALMRKKLRLVRDAYGRCGVRWTIFTDVDVAAMADLDTVDDLIANAGRPVELADLRRLTDFLRSRPHFEATLGECEEVLRDLEFPRGDILARVPERVIEIDLMAPVMGSTIVRLAEGVR